MGKIICIVCPRGCNIEIYENEQGFATIGNYCLKGKEYAINEMISPKRSVTSTVKTSFKALPRLPVRTDRDIDRKDIFAVMKQLDKVTINYPVHGGDILVANILNSGVNIIATLDMFELFD